MDGPAPGRHSGTRFPYEVDAYQAWHEEPSLEAKPGITGLWQVNVSRAEVASPSMKWFVLIFGKQDLVFVARY